MRENVGDDLVLHGIGGIGGIGAIGGSIYAWNTLSQASREAQRAVFGESSASGLTKPPPHRLTP